MFCNKPGCRKCPHNAYWYAYFHANGKKKKQYVGKALPAGVVEPQAAPPPPPPPPPLTLQQAARQLGGKALDGLIDLQRKWQARRRKAAALGDAGRAELVRLDAAWKVVHDHFYDL